MAVAASLRIIGGMPLPPIALSSWMEVRTSKIFCTEMSMLQIDISGKDKGGSIEEEELVLNTE